MSMATKTITKSQLKQMIKEAIREQNSQTLNENFFDPILGKLQKQTGKFASQIADDIIDHLQEAECRKILKAIIDSGEDAEYQFFLELEELYYEDKKELVNLVVNATGADLDKILPR